MQIFIWWFILLIGNESRFRGENTTHSSGSKLVGCMQHSKLISSLYGDLLQESEPFKCESNEEKLEEKNVTSSANEESEPFEEELRDCSSSSIAEKAAEVAKAANDAQVSAAQDAAKQVKTQAAHKAIQAARALQATILEGKQVIVDNYEQEICEANDFVSQVDNELKSSAENAASVHSMTKTFECQLSNLKQLMQQTRNSIRYVDSLQELAETDLEEKTQMLETLQDVADDLDRQVAQAKIDDECVKEADEAKETPYEN